MLVLFGYPIEVFVERGHLILKDGIGPKDKRPVRADLAWHALETNRFGTDEFLRYAGRIGAEPYICINLGLGTIDDARHWVEYTNESRHTGPRIL